MDGVRKSYASEEFDGMNLLRPLQICLGSTLLLCSVQAQAVAQSFLQEDRNSLPIGANRTGVPIPEIFIPTLPPIRSTLPESVETAVRLVLSRRDRRVYLYQGDEQVGSYPVAIGRSGWETPLGTWQVIDMQENPAWEHPFTGEIVPPGPDNPLGERWIGFWTDGRNYIGFHGTPTRESVGRAASHGCVRMFNEDVRELYTIVELGTPIVVQP